MWKKLITSLPSDVFSALLLRSPFSLDEDDSENLARFLVEDNLQDVIKLRMTMEADNVLVRSRLRFLLGSIRVFT